MNDITSLFMYLTVLMMQILIGVIILHFRLSKKFYDYRSSTEIKLNGIKQRLMAFEKRKRA